MSDRVISDPRSGRRVPIRQFLQERYGMSIDGVPRRGPRRAQSLQHRSRVVKGLTSPAPHSSLNPSLRRNHIEATHVPRPTLRASDLSHGLHSLIERGLIPPALDLTAAIATFPSPVTTAPVPVHSREFRTARPPVVTGDFTSAAAAAASSSGLRGGGFSNIKYDFVTAPMAEAEMEQRRRIRDIRRRKRQQQQQRVGGSRRRRRRRTTQRRENGVSVVDMNQNSQFPPINGQRTRGLGRSQALLVEDDEDESTTENLEARGYHQMLDQYSMHHLMIRRGVLVTDTPEFMSFQRSYRLRWGPIVTILKELERLLHSHDIPIAFIDGKLVEEISRVALEEPSEEELLRCIVNYEEVIRGLESGRTTSHSTRSTNYSLLAQEQQIRRRERRIRQYDGTNGKQFAAIRIQTIWRKYRAKRLFFMLLKRNRSAKKILVQWNLRKKFFETRERINVIVRQRELRWEKEIMPNFREDWIHRMSNSNGSEERRLIVHIPSISGEMDQRESMEELYRYYTNSQLGRLLDLLDPSVDIIFVSPIPEPEDAIDYMISVIQSGISEEDARLFDSSTEGLRRRLTILVPDHIDSFPNHISLSRLLNYSPRTMKFIQTKAAGRHAWIVPGRVGEEELRVASKLGLPILGPHPRTSASFSLNKHLAKKVFELSNVFVPPGSGLTQLGSAENDLRLILAKCIIERPDVHRWIIKLNHEFGTRGIAFLDVSSIRALDERSRMALLEDEAEERRARMGFDDYVSDDSEDEELDAAAALDKLRDEVYFELRNTLEHAVVMPCRFAYPTWRQFLAAANAHGCYVEPCADDILGSFVVNLFISPTGQVEIHSIQERITHQCFFTSCYAYPQLSIPDEALSQPSITVARTLHQRGTIGYVSIEYVAFEDPESGHVRLWGLDIRQQLTDNALYHRIFEHVTSEVLPDERSTLRYLYTGLIRHASFHLWRHSVFFHEVRQAGLLFDLDSHKGIVFHLVDVVMKGLLGVLCIGKSKLDVVRYLHGFVNFVQEKNDENLYDVVHEVTKESDLSRVVGGLQMLLSRSLAGGGGGQSQSQGG